MEKIKVLHRRKRNSVQVMEEVKRLFKILYNYDIDMRAYMYEETIQDLKEKRYIISEFIKEAIDSLISEADENIGYDDELVEFNNGYIEKLSSLNIELIQAWQDNIINIVNVEYDTLYTKYSLRKVII